MESSRFTSHLKSEKADITFDPPFFTFEMSPLAEPGHLYFILESLRRSPHRTEK